MKPDSTKHNPDPEYLRELVKKTGLSQRKIARIIGVNERLFRMYLANRSASTAHDAPYTVQFTLECLSDES